MGGFFCSADYFSKHTSLLHKTVDQKEPQSVLYNAWKAKTQRYVSYRETACEDLLWGITTENVEERARIGLIPTNKLLTGLR